tara:strand:+ start:3285 stop:3878 length:594 start_codon:yes stop_codon:yes gene_type:complete
MMSKLSDLAKGLTPKSSLRNNENSIMFSQKYPVIVKTFDDAPLSDLRDDILKCGDVQKQKTNVQADMTNWFMHHTHSSFQWVCDRAIEIASENNPHKINMFVYDCWGAVYKQGDFTKEHDHWPALWSFVFYVDCCEDCAPLVFPTTLNNDDPLRHSKVFYPKNGKMIVFPAWIIHNVLKQTCNHDRIMVAGNIRLSK